MPNAPADALERARRVRLMVFDVDGVLTDGKLWYGPQGETLKAFYVRDGMGLRLLAESGIALALQHPVKPDVIGTVFAGGDIEATERARSYFTGYPPSSPSIAILRDGKLVYMMERRQIENQTAEAIARNLTDAFEQVSGPAGAGAAR